jgi:hypothetical protein
MRKPTDKAADGRFMTDDIKLALMLLAIGAMLLLGIWAIASWGVGK